ncbi:MAG: hypothetical protein WDZ88_01050 [Candidatus Paceibacterota bacterium]
MFLLTVIPISRGIRVTQLSYFCSTHIPSGSFVTIPLRNKSAKALVVKCSPAEEEKASIKNAGYALKKIVPKNIKTQFDEALISASQKVANHYATNLGGILFHTVPTAYYEAVFDSKKILPKKTRHFEQVVLQAPDADRFAQYKSIVREAFAQKDSVCVIAPTQHDVEKLYATLSRGIESYTYTLHGSLTKKQQKETAENAQKNEHPVLVIATPPFLSLPRGDIQTLILERESSRAYRSRSRPYITFSYFVEEYARKRNIHFIRADTLISLETFKTLDDFEPVVSSSLAFRPLTSAQCTTVDMEEERKKAVLINQPWSVLSNQLRTLIEKAHDESKQLFLFNAKRGLSPTTLCGDCGTIVSCTQCQKNVVLHKTSKGNIFLCHRCGEKRSAKEVCVNCESWNLKTYGVGTERIVEEIEQDYPNAHVFLLDSNSAPTYAKGKKIFESFKETPGGILVGTETAIHFITDPLPFIGVVSLDSFFAIPDFRINERIVSLITTLRTTATEQFLLQTREPDQSCISLGMRGSLLEFLREEYSLRKDFGYPPFTVPIRISVSGKKDSARKNIESIAEALSEYSPKTFPAFVQKKGVFTMHLILFVPEKEWVIASLSEYLQSLPQDILVTIDPETIL